MTADLRVLVVDDEPMVREVLTRYLERDGFAVDSVADGERALAAFVTKEPDLVLLDLMLPRLDGFEVFRRIRERSANPVIMITARGADTDRVVGLELGADDYVSKPFSPTEVVARVKAVLRRTAPLSQSRDETALRFDRFELDPAAHEVRVDGELVSITPREFELLRFFACHPRVVFSRLQLLEELWDIAFDGDPATVTVHIRRLREKIETDPSDPRHIVTVWGVGYRFEP